MAVLDLANSEFNYSNVSSITTDFNVSPYYDDFDNKKNFYKILFKPGYAVQARELTQIQSVLQDQISKFGQHIFKEGSMVLGGKFDIDTRVNFVKVNDFDLNGETVDINLFKDEIVTGQITGIKAYVNLVLDGSEGTDKPKTLYVTYVSSNPNTNEVVFRPNESLTSNVGTLTVGNTVPVGFGSVFTLNEGVRFAKEHFIYHTKQSIVVDRYDIFPTCRVGFFLEESIVDATQDSSLLDPALESSNFAAPGADRFKINPVLTRLDIDDVQGFPDYVNLFTIEKGVVTEISERPMYNVIRDEIAKRTMDESGDYYVKGFNTVIEEHLDLGNAGYLSLARGGDSQLLSVQVEPGTAYVKGYEVNKLVTSFLSTEKSIAHTNVINQITSTRVGNYLLVNEAVGAWNLNSGQSIDLYDTAQRRISEGLSSTAPQTGKKIGSARIKSIFRVFAPLGNPAGTIAINLFDVSMLGSNSFADVKSVYYDVSGGADIGADVVLQANTAKLNDPYATSLYYVGSDYTKSTRLPDSPIDTSFYFKRSSDVSISSGTFSLATTVTNEIFPYGTGTVSDSDLDDIFVTLNSSLNIALPGASNTNYVGGSTTLNGTGTFFTRLNPGDKIEITGNTKTYVVANVINDSVLTVTTNLPYLIGNNFYKAYKAGDMIDLTLKGVTAGAERVVTSTPTSLSFDLKESTLTSNGTVSYTMARTAAREIRKVLRPNRYVLINCSLPFSGNTTGPFNLGFSDVYRIKSIRKKSSSFSSVDEGDLVTSDFVLDNGQRDSHYGNARIIPYSPLSSSDNLLVCLDYFQPDYTLGVGYFSIDSYPVNDSNPTDSQITTPEIPVFRSPDTGQSYDLRNHFDFRPVYTNTAADATILAAATTNPTVATTFQSESLGLRLPADSQPMTYDYSYYFARRDVVAIDRNGKFTIIKGQSSKFPVTPLCPPTLMSVAKMYIPPYPSLSPYYGKQLGRGDLTCSISRTAQIRYTMRDIGVIKQRVDNLENYVSLSLLEKSALDLKILDEYGLDRFKNGIFVDPFTSFTLSDYQNPDHHICYDPEEGSIRPIYESHAIGYDYKSGSGVTVEDNIVMLPYTETIAVRQPYATTFRNVETTVFRFVGKMYLDPDSDYWVNTNRLAAQVFEFGATDADIDPYSVVYGAFRTVITGRTTTDPALISSTQTSHTQTNVIGSPGSTTYTLNFSNNAKTIESLRTVRSLIDLYGATTPVTLTGQSMGGGQTLGAGVVLADDPRFSTIKNLGDLTSISNRTVLAQLAAFNLKITTTGSTSTDVTTQTTDTYSVSTTTSSQQIRNYTETLQSIQYDKISYGDRITAIAPIADIRPQTIAFEARGVKQSTRHFVFFDGQLMTSYITPGILSNTVTQFSNTNSTLISATGSEGSDLYSNEDGIVCGFLRIPSDSVKSFRTGTKEVVVTDSPTNEPDATSTAKAYFAAQGIDTSVQETIISTGHIVTETRSGIDALPTVYSNTTNVYTVTNTSVVTTNTLGIITATIADRISCMAYSFKLNTPSGEEGTFLSSVDVFFAGKDPGLGVWFEIRAMDNNGVITKVQVPGSEVWLTSNQVNTSDDGSVATNIKFKAPIFLLNNQEYAFVIHTVGINPNYYMFVSVLGEEDILTKLAVNNRPLTGTLFTTNNNTDWDIVPRTDLKCNFYRAKFDTNSVGEAIISNQSREYVQLPLTRATGSNTSWFGERILGNDELNLSTFSGVINVGDYLIGANSGANSAVSSNSGTYNMTNTGYVVGEPITVRRANGLLTTISSTVASKNTASGKIYKVIPKNDPLQFNGNTAVLVVEGTNGLFKANDVLHMEISGNTVNTIQVTKQIYSSVQFESSYLSFIPTTCEFSMLTVSNTGTPGVYESIPIGEIVDFDTEKAIFSKSIENSLLSGDASNRVKIRMQTNTDYLSPIVNLNRTYTVYIRNLVNSNTTNELLPTGGSLKNKYISQVVTLADGQDAEDLRIIITAYKPPGANSDIKVYARMSNSEDFESIYQRNWIEMESFDNTVFSSLANRKDWREFQYRFPSTAAVGYNDQYMEIVGYTNGANTIFAGFKQFQVKIGLQSDSSAIYPRAADLRAIALQI